MAAALIGGSAAAQSPTSRRPGLVRPMIEGLAAGVMLGFSYVSPSNDAWLLPDGDAVILSMMTGIGTAYGIQRYSADVDALEPRRPRLRVAMGRSSRSKFDHAFALRMPTTKYLDTQVGIVLSSDGWEKSEFQTRCGMFGCFSGQYTIDSRYDQTAAAMISGVLRLAPSLSASPTLAIGAGPSLTHTQRFETRKAKRSGIIADATLGFETPGRSRWTADVGVRLVTSAHYRHDKYVRIGRAFGY